MHEKAVAANVPFQPLPNSGRYRIPSDLRSAHARLSQGQQLSSAQEREVIRNYGHRSDHYDLCVAGIFPMAPNASGRIRHANQPSQAR